jgi:hypothetical protein
MSADGEGYEGGDVAGCVQRRLWGLIMDLHGGTGMWHGLGGRIREQEYRRDGKK